MKIIQKKDKMTKIETELYQARDGSIRINFGRGSMLVPKSLADDVARDVDDLDEDAYISFYGSYYGSLYN